VAKWPCGALQPVKKGRLKRPKIANMTGFLNLSPLILLSKSILPSNIVLFQGPNDGLSFPRKRESRLIDGTGFRIKACTEQNKSLP